MPSLLAMLRNSLVIDGSVVQSSTRWTRPVDNTLPASPWPRRTRSLAVSTVRCPTTERISRHSPAGSTRNRPAISARRTWEVALVIASRTSSRSRDASSLVATPYSAANASCERSPARAPRTAKIRSARSSSRSKAASRRSRATTRSVLALIGTVAAGRSASSPGPSGGRSTGSSIALPVANSSFGPSLCQRTSAPERLAVRVEAAIRTASATRSGPTADASRIDSTATVQSAPCEATDAGVMPPHLYLIPP